MARMISDRYMTVDKCGSGGMAMVYKAKDTYLDRYVAIKVLRKEYIGDPAFVNIFRKESQAAARLSDPNIVSIYDVGKENNIHYIVMEYIEGPSLGEIIEKEAPLSESRVIGLTRQIASGLRAAHQKGIIHRDIKPHNILISKDGVVKIADFGIAKAVNRSTTLVYGGPQNAMGSVHYMSPEHAQGVSVDARSDIYSLGIVMYEMLTGAVPFDGDTPVSVMMKHIKENVPRPSLKNSSVSRAMDYIVCKACAKRPEDRFASADELMEALDQAKAELSSSRNEANRTHGVSDDYVIESKRNWVHDEEELPQSEEDDLQRRLSTDSSTAVLGTAMDGLDASDEKGQSGTAGAQKTRKRKKKKRGSGKIKVLAVVLALVCAVPLSMALMNTVSGLNSGIEVPDVRGMTRDQAEEKLEERGLEYELGTSVASTEYDEGEVVSTEPSAGTNVRKGYTVTIHLSRNSDSTQEEVTVPDVTDMKLSRARSEIIDEGLKVGDITYTYSDTVEDGRVIRQSPSGGEDVESGTRVSLVVSRGAEKVTVEVPNLIGMTQSEANTALRNQGLSAGTVTEEYSDKEAGLVISQSVSAGTSVAQGEEINFVVSKGPDPSAKSNESEKNETEQDNTGSDAEKTIQYTIDPSESEDEIFSLTVTLTNEQGEVTHVISNESHKRSESPYKINLTGSGQGTVRVLMNDKIVKVETVNF